MPPFGPPPGQDRNRMLAQPQFDAWRAAHLVGAVAAAAASAEAINNANVAAQEQAQYEAAMIQSRGVLIAELEQHLNAIAAMVGAIVPAAIPEIEAAQALAAQLS